MTAKTTQKTDHAQNSQNIAAAHDYIKKVRTIYAGGNATEHSYRGDLQNFLAQISSCTVINEPQAEAFGKPDYIITKKDFTVGYIEAKDIGIDLGKAQKSEQLSRYLGALDNLILTDYLEFRFFRYGECVAKMRLGSVEKGKVVVARDEEIEKFLRQADEFFSFGGIKIKSATQLATIMAKKAQLLNDYTHETLVDERSELYVQFLCFRNELIDDLQDGEFADIYAQTLVYGLFAARLSEKGEGFSSWSSGELIPKTNPFLRKFFNRLVSIDLDEKIKWIVDELAEVFKQTDLDAIFENESDPFIHFYETFLASYNSALRKNRGVYYTPKPVVSFIVRSVDKILQTEFDKRMGLASDVKILDPATGTGNFLYESFCEIYKKFEKQKPLWQDYVDQNLLERVFGFEIMMSPYAMCHLKLGNFLTQTGWQNKHGKRLNIFLTNSLNAEMKEPQTAFDQFLVNESRGANAIKHGTVMVVLGNPPYNVSSFNKSKFIEDLLVSYKKDLNEKNIQPLSDDYIKFIRLAQDFIERNESGVVAYITNNGFIDGLIHRKMRENLLQTFDAIYILNLHGNAKKKEKTPKGEVDKNVFDIQQGVSINFFIKGGKTKGVFYADVWGERQSKFDFLYAHDISNTKWKKLKPKAPEYFFVPKDNSLQKEWNKFFAIDELMQENLVGVKTGKDDASICLTEKECEKLKKDFLTLDAKEIYQKYGFTNARDWKIEFAKEDLKTNPIIAKEILYRPFDVRKMNYTGKTKGIMECPRYKVMKNFIIGENIALLISRQGGASDLNNWNVIFVTDKIVDLNIFRRGGGNVFPLYIYDDGKKDGGEAALDLGLDERQAGRCANFSAAVTEKIRARIGDFEPDTLFYYMYAVLHSPSYRARYKEFLKIGFPRLPYPESAVQFAAIAEKGKYLADLHLMTAPVLDDIVTSFEGEGSNVVDKPRFVAAENDESRGYVWINDVQFFGGVERGAWEFFVGGYQPLQKYLKDRKGRTLSYAEILHWQRMVVALRETARVMEEL